jgi:hypothetical protein
MTLPGGESFHLGYSRLSTFLQCPKQFKYSYIDKIREPGGIPMRRGQAYHASLETLLKWKIENEEDPYKLTRAEKLAIRCAKAEQLTDSEVYRVIDAVRFYYTELYPFHKPVAVEQDFKIVRGGVEITGRVDIIERMGVIGDHKFSYDTWADSRARYGCQPIIYQWAGIDCFEPRYPEWKYQSFKYYILKLFPNPLIQVIEVPKISQAASDWWEDQIYEIAKTIRRGYFPATPSDKVCSYCAHKKRCNPVIYKIKKHNIGEPESEDIDVG